MHLQRRILCSITCFVILFCSSCTYTSNDRIKEPENPESNIATTLGNIFFADSGLSIINDMENFGDYLSVPAIKSSKTLTAEQKTAALLARSYLIGSAFSRSGLVLQLQSDGFDTDMAELAVDFLSVDWQIQAVKRAKLLTQYEDYTLESLKDRLVSCKFTTEESEYAADYVINSRDNLGVAILRALSADKNNKLEEVDTQ